MKIRFPFIFIILLYFTFLGGSLYQFTSFPLKVFNHIVVMAIFSGWLWTKFAKRDTSWGFPKTSLDIAIIFWLVVQFISASQSIDPRFSFEALWQPISHAIMFYLLLDIIPHQQQKFIRALYLSSGVVCIIGLTEFVSWYFGISLLAGFEQSWHDIGGWTNPIPPHLYRLNFTLNGSTSLAAYLALFIPPAIALRLTTYRHEDKQVLTAWLILAIVVLVLTSSRGGFLALFISLPILFIGRYVTSKSSVVKTKKVFENLSCLTIIPCKLKQLIVARFDKGISEPRFYIITGVILILLLSFIMLGVFLQRLQGNSTLSGDLVRWDLWRSAIHMTVDHPITGVGPKLYGRFLRQYRNPELARDQMMTAHNIYLNTAAETGMLGILAGIFLIGMGLIAFRRNWQTIPHATTRLRLIAIFASLCGFAGQSIVDTFNATQIILPMLIGIAFLIIPLTEAPNPSPTGRWAEASKLALIITLICGYAFFLIRSDIAQYYAEKSADLALQGKLHEAISMIEHAHNLDPNMIFYQFELAYYQGEQANIDKSYLPHAIANYDMALQSEGSNPVYHANLAKLLLQAGEPESAIKRMKMAIAMSPDDAIYRLNLGDFYEQLGNESESLHEYALAVQISPPIIMSGLWDAEERNRIIDTVSQQTDDMVVLYTLKLANKSYHEVEQAIRDKMEYQSEALRLLLAKSLIGQNQTEEAEIILTELIEHGDIEGNLYALRGKARWLGNTENHADAIQDLKMARFLNAYKNAESNYYLGRIYEARGELEKAKSFYWQAVPPQMVSLNYEIVVFARKRHYFPYISQLIYVDRSIESSKSLLHLLELYENESDIKNANLVHEQLKLLYPYLYRINNLPHT